MTNNNYELRIISNEQASAGKVLKKYIIDGQETIGVVENEPFAIEFKNKTWSKIQVKISVDGTDIQTGSLASTSPEGVMWFVEPYGTLRLKAWPETANGGAEFMFSSLENSVVNNLNGNIQSNGIIAAAIFIEGYSPYNAITWRNQVGNVYAGGQLAGALYGNNGVISNNSNSVRLGQSVLRSKHQMINSSESMGVLSNASLNCINEQDNLAVGAGEYVAQEIVKVAGLTKPKLDTTISVKYEAWNSLRSKVRALQKQVANPSNPAFPGDAQMKMIDLKDTPRKNKPRKPVRTPDLQRF